MNEPIAIAVVSPEERAERQREGASLVVQANDVTITDGDAFAKAAKWLQDVVVPLKRKIAETFRPRIQQAHLLHKGLVEDEKRFLAPVEGAERIVRGKLAAYEQEQARKRREAEEAQRREQERLEAAERERQRQERERLQREAEDRRIAEAIAAEARGDKETATRLVEAPVEVPVVLPRLVVAPPPVVEVAPKVDGLSFRDEWDFEITDPDSLPLEYRMPDEKKIRQVVKAMREKTRISGVRAFARRVPTVRS